MTSTAWMVYLIPMSRAGTQIHGLTLLFFHCFSSPKAFDWGAMCFFIKEADFQSWRGPHSTQREAVKGPTHPLPVRFFPHTEPGHSLIPVRIAPPAQTYQLRKDATNNCGVYFWERRAISSLQLVFSAFLTLLAPLNLFIAELHQSPLCWQ